MSKLNGKPLHNQFVCFDTKECLFCYAFKAAYERGKREAELAVERIKELTEIVWDDERHPEDYRRLVLATLNDEKMTTEPVCADGDTCKRINGRIQHDRFCDNINHGDE